MSFQSPEQKIIYEKLTTGPMADTYEREKDGLYGPGDEISDKANLQHLQGSMDKVISYIGTMDQTRVNTSLRALSTGDRKITAWLAILIKRVVRRLTRWYVEPVCQQQTAFNNAVAPSIGRITEINHAMIHNVLTLFREQAQLRVQQHALQAELRASIDRVADMERAFMTRLTEMETSHTARFEAASASHEALEAVQHVGNQQLTDLQHRIDKLLALDLDVFSETYQDPWERDVWGVGTFAQSGEDMILAFILRVYGMPFSAITYIDLGANHAKKLSNTYHFYRNGSRGVLVEANPTLIPELKFYRHGDVILNRCVSDRSGDEVDFYIIGDSYASGDGLSTPDKESALHFTTINPNLKIHDTVSVKTVSVNDIVENYLGHAPTILNIDIEGNELEILKSIDFSNIRPLVIVIEMIPYTLPFVITGKNQAILDYLVSKDYLEYAFTGVNSIFLDKSQLRDRGMIE